MREAISTQKTEIDPENSPSNIKWPEESDSDEELPRKRLKKDDYSCELCGAVFTQKSCLNKHEKTEHSDITEFPCRYC